MSPDSIAGITHPLALSLLAPCLLASACTSAPAASLDPHDPSGRPTIEAHTSSMVALDGLLPLYFDEEEGQLFFEPPAEQQELLYYISLPSGLGSNDVGLDRAQLGPRRLVIFRRMGARVLLVAPNMSWRSSSPSEAVRAGVRESFAESVLFGFDIVAGEGERVLVEGTEFFLRDAHGISRTLQSRGQGSFSLESSRSGLDRAGLASFTTNSEIEALLTFRSDSPGGEVRSTAADASSVSFRVRHSFVALPDLARNEYRPRRYDPRSGFNLSSWNDVSVPIDQPMTQRVVTRHHLTKDSPIVYYVDSAAPEPVRSALLEGARYWVPVFEKAGFPGGYRVELLPPGADIQDVHNNVITWVNRSTRGWSYGMSVSDPRTGEILKGHVSLGALRVRQDVLLMEGLLSPYGDGKNHDERVTEAALDRIRQLAAHEVGHTLGLAHNFASSADGRASVMDYPAPLVTLAADGTVDVSSAYAHGCGAWDEAAIRYGYADFGGDEEAGLARVLAEMRESGLRYLSDSDARGGGRAHPLANLWDNGSDSIAALRETYRVRRAALDRLSSNALVEGRPLADLEGTLVPLYLHHRYQIEAAARLIGGLNYEYAMVRDGADGKLVPVEGARQLEALALVLEALTPDFLRLSAELRAQLVPPPPGYRRSRESFVPGARFFDANAAVRAGADVALSLVLHPERLARLADQEETEGLPSLEEVLSLVIDGVYPPSADAASAERLAPVDRAIMGEVRQLVAERMMRLIKSDRTDARVRSAAWVKLGVIGERTADEWQADVIRRFLEDPDAETAGETSAPRVPPGSPIGCGMGL